MGLTYDEIFKDCSIKPRGMVHVTGPSGVGKSLFCIGLVELGLDPKRIAVLDGESSLQQHHESVSGGLFGYYFNITAERMKRFGLFSKPRSIISMLQEEISKLPEVDVVILDNVVPVEDALQDYVETNPTEFGYTANQIATMSGIKWGPIKRLYSSLLQQLQSKANLAFVTSQLSPFFAGKQPLPGVFKPQGKGDILSQQATLKIWLRYNPKTFPYPEGLVLKSRVVRPSTSQDGKMEWIPVLPHKLVPANWKHIFEYLMNPPDFSKLKKEEIPTAEDWNILRGTLSQEQLKLFEILAKSGGYPEEETDETSRPSPKAAEPTVPTTSAEFIMALNRLGLNLPDALSKLGKTNIGDVDPADDFTKLTNLVGGEHD